MMGSFVQSWFERDELGSTSDLARALVAEPGLAYPLLVRARRQTRGRGRGSNVWWSDEGSLTFTLALDPSAHGLRPEHQPRVALAVAVAIVETLAPRIVAPRSLGIRWPNDVEAGGKKLAGILPERVETPEGPRLLIGLGLNVATRLDDGPAEVRRMAASLRELVPDNAPTPSTDAILEDLLIHLPNSLERLAANDQGLAQRWADLDALRLATIQVNLGTRIIEGVAQGVDAEGALLLAAGAETHRLFGGQVLRPT